MSRRVPGEKFVGGIASTTIDTAAALPGAALELSRRIVAIARRGERSGEPLLREQTDILVDLDGEEVILTISGDVIVGRGRDRTHFERDVPYIEVVSARTADNKALYDLSNKPIIIGRVMVKDGEAVELIEGVVPTRGGLIDAYVVPIRDPNDPQKILLQITPIDKPEV